MSDREAFLQRVRQAVRQGQPPGLTPPLPEREPTLSYQGGGADPVAHFGEAIQAAGGRAIVVPDGRTARLQVVQVLQERSVRRVLLGAGPVIDSLDLARALTDLGYEVAHAAGADRATLFAAEVGVTGADHLIAETGSVITRSAPDQPRSQSLLPPLHVVVAHRDQILPDLFDLFAQAQAPPSCLTVITGPSKTGDIELRLVTGVHGPGEVVVILIAPPT